MNLLYGLKPNKHTWAALSSLLFGSDDLNSLCLRLSALKSSTTEFELISGSSFLSILFLTFFLLSSFLRASNSFRISSL